MPGEIHDFWRFFDGKLKKMQRFQPSFFGLGLLGSGLWIKKSHFAGLLDLKSHILPQNSLFCGFESRRLVGLLVKSPLRYQFPATSLRRGEGGNGKKHPGDSRGH